MSDLSALSNDYEATSQFAETVNTAVLSLKKSLHQPHPQLQSEPLAAIVAAVREQLTSSAPSAAIPSEVVERLSTEHKSDFNYLVEDLHTAEVALRGEAPIDLRVIGVLDTICDAADASASAMFRRLRRR
jgi:hypothetical protein